MAVVPTDIYETVEKLAVEEHRTISKMVVLLITEAIENRKSQDKQ
ncbi:MAG: ribbon-helix-helix domain-containing protein [Dolichospermum sp.]